MTTQTMIQIYSRKRIFLILLLFSFSTVIFSEESWIIAAQQFENVRGNNDSVSNGITAMFPKRILEKLSSSLYRNVTSDEEHYDEILKLKTQRTSLFLQLSSEIKKRDSLVTYSYSEKELNRKITEENKKIEEIKKSIDENLEQQKKLEEEIENGSSEEDSENSNFFSDLIDSVKNGKSSSDSKSQLKKVSLYKNDFSVLFEPSRLAESSGYESSVYEKEAVAEKINGVITGKISMYGEYFSLTVELYLYPGCKKAASVTEVGSLDYADITAASVAGQLTPFISNSLPVKINLSIHPEEAAEGSFFVDSELISLSGSEEKNITLESGVHLLQFSCPGYKSISFSYGFEGNRTYDIDVKMEASEEKTITIQLPQTVTGDIFLRGNKTSLNSVSQSDITINDSKLLGIVVSENNDKGFFVIPEGLSSTSEALQLNLKSIDHSAYIEKHRRSMYTSYSILLTSLIPTFFTMGQSNIYSTAYSGGYLGSDSYAALQGWNLASKICTGVSIGCGVWFVYELVRYLYAANSVLPVEAKKLDINLLRQIPEPSETEETSESENTQITESEAE